MPVAKVAKALKSMVATTTVRLNREKFSKLLKKTLGTYDVFY